MSDPTRYDPSSSATVTTCDPHELDVCNFVATPEDTDEVEDVDPPCGQPAVACLITTDAQGRGVLLKLCHTHMFKPAVTLIQEVE